MRNVRLLLLLLLIRHVVFKGLYRHWLVDGFGEQTR